MARQLFKAPEQATRTQTQTRAPMLDLRQQTRTQTEAKQQQKAMLNQLQLQRVLNRKRSQEYVDAMKRMDAGGHMHNQNQVNALLDVIREEMPEIEIEMGPIGIVSRCYLGSPYEVHTLDIMGSIIEHYEVFRPLPNGMEKARRLALNGNYAFIEVYHHELRAVSDNGTVATLKE